MEAKFHRNIKPGHEYDHLIAKARNVTIPIKKFATVEDTLKEAKKIVKETLSQTERLAEVLQGNTLEATCRNIWNFVYWHIQYRNDKAKIEQLREPARIWHDRAGDCDCFSILISSILSNLGIPHVLRITKYVREDGLKPFWQHIYPIVPLDGDVHGKNNFSDTDKKYITIDCVPDKYDYEVKYLEKKDFPMELHRLAELGNIEEETLRGLAELGFSEQKIGILAEISEEEGYTIGSLAELLGEYDESELLMLQGLLNACECNIEELNGLLANHDPEDLVELSALGELTGDMLCELGALSDDQIEGIREEERLDEIDERGRVFTNPFNSPTIIDNQIVSPGFVVGIDNKGNKWMLKSISYKFHYSDWVPFDPVLAENWQYQALGELAALGKSAKKVAKKAEKKAKKEEKKEKKAEKKAVKKQEKAVFKAERKEYKAQKKEIKKLPKSERKIAKRELKVNKPKTKVGKALQKASKVVNKLNPGTVLIRNGLLAAMKVNMSKVAEKLRFGYLSEEQARERGMDMDVWKDLKNQVTLKERSFEALGGEKKKLKAAILNGKGNKDDKKVLAGLEEDALYGFYETNPNIAQAANIESLQGLGEPATAVTGVSLAAAAATVAKWLADLNKTASAAKSIFPGDKKATDEYNAPPTSDGISDLINEAKQFAPGVTVNPNQVTSAVGQDPDALIQKATGEALQIIAQNPEAVKNIINNPAVQNAVTTYMQDGTIPAMDVPRAGSDLDNPFPTSNTQNNPPMQEKGLSTGAKIGIGVGALTLTGLAITAVVMSVKEKKMPVSGLEGTKTKKKTASKKDPCKEKSFKKVGVIKI